MVPGSISSALTMTYLGRRASTPMGTPLHFSPVGKPAPPRPRSRDFLTSSWMSSGAIWSALRRAW